MEAKVSDLLDLVELAAQERDDTMTEQFNAECEDIALKLRDMQFQLQMSGPYDRNGALLAVKAGAGGADAQDWTEILLRMYMRWAERRKFKTTVLDHSAGDEAGVKSASIRIEGEYAYGFLASERGVHRLVRLSPFNANHLRHTSFSLVEVLPELSDEEKGAVELNPDDLKFEYFRASGHGGQNVQKNSTAVRVKHAPSGITVSVQNERSQSQNKDIALRILQGRLAEREQERQRAKTKELKGEHKSAEFGNQARSYVMHPYQQVRDHRTGHKEADVDAVLDGSIDGFIEAYFQSAVDAAK